MLEIEALEREAEKREERAKEEGEKEDGERDPSSAAVSPSPPQLGPSMAPGESDEDDDEEEDGDDEEEEGGERERPVRLTNHTCEWHEHRSGGVSLLKEWFLLLLLKRSVAPDGSLDLQVDSGELFGTKIKL